MMGKRKASPGASMASIRAAVARTAPSAALNAAIVTASLKKAAAFAAAVAAADRDAPGFDFASGAAS